MTRPNRLAFAVILSGNLAGAPAVLGGASVFVGAGVVSITGPVSRLTIGGNDLRVENVCAVP